MGRSRSQYNHYCFPCGRCLTCCISAVEFKESSRHYNTPLVVHSLGLLAYRSYRPKLFVIQTYTNASQNYPSRTWRGIDSTTDWYTVLCMMHNYFV